VKAEPVSARVAFRCAVLYVRWNGRGHWNGSSSPASDACRQRTPLSSCIRPFQTCLVLVT